MTQAVTELVVRGDGAIATLDKFSGKMEAAGSATDRSTGAVDAYNAAMAKATVAQERGLAVTTQRVERITAEQRALERWQARLDPAMKLEIQLNREAQRAAVDMANAVILGYTSQEKALSTLSAMEERHATQLRAITTIANDNASANATLAARTEELRLRFDAAHASAVKLDAELNDLSEAERLGVQITGGYAAALDRLILKYDVSAAAAASAANAQREFIANARAAQAAQNAQQVAAANQAHFNTVLGVDSASAGSARQSAAAFEEAARAANDEAVALDRLRSKYNPLYAEIQRYRAAQAEIRQAHAMGALGADEMAAAIGRERTAALAAIAAIKNLRSAEQSARNSFAGFNAGQQLQDIAMMSMLGQSPGALALQQGPQLATAIEQGGGLAALKAGLMSLFSPTMLVTTGLVGLTAVAIQFATSLGSKASPEAEEFSKWLQKVGTDANTAAEFLERVNKAVHDLTVVDLNKLTRQGGEFIKQQRAQLSNPLAEAAGYEGNLADPKFVETYNLIDSVLDKLRSDDGFQNIDELHEALNKIIAESPFLQKFAEQWEALGEAILKAKEAAEQTAHEAELAAHGMSAYQARDGEAMQKYLDKNIETLQQLKKEREAAFKDLYAKSPAELAAAAYANEMAKPLDPNETPEVRAYRAMTASALAYAQAERQITEANEARLRSLDNSLASQKLENDLIGAGVKQAAAARLEFQQVQEVHDEAIRNGVTGEEEFQKVYGGLIDKIHERAQAYGEAAEAAAKANLADNLAFERDQLGRSDTEQRVADQLHAIYGDDYKSHMQDATAEQIRFNEELKKTGELGKDAFDSIIDALTSSGDLVDNLISAFAQLGKQFAQIGADNLFDWMTGKSSSPFGSTPQFGGGNSVANTRIAGKAIGETIAPPITKSLNSGLDTYAAAIRKIESGSYEGNYGAVNATSGATGAYQVMPGNIAAWTKEVTGVAMTQKDFLNDRAAQDKVFYTKFGQALDKYGNVSDAMAVWFSGGPLATNSNKSDGSNTAAQYVSKAVSALDAYPGTLKQAVSDGSVDANRRIVNSVNSGRFSDGFDTSAPKSVAGGGNGLQNLLGVGGAAIGAFAGGYQSGSPIMGGISGALSGAGAASSIAGLLGVGMGVAAPIGLIGGAILGVVGGILGKAKQAKEQLHNARVSLGEQIGAITEMIASATGNFIGTYQKQFTDTIDEFRKAINLAKEAHNKALQNELTAAEDTFFSKLTDKWKRGFQGMLDSMNAGLGLDGEFSSGMDAVDKMRESLIGFVNDAKFFANNMGDLDTAMSQRAGPKKDQPTMYPYDPNNTESEYANAVEQAQAAAQNSALAALSGGKSFTDMEEAMQRLQGAAAELPDLLTDLGLSADAAAKAIQLHLNTAIHDLQSSLSTDLVNSINSLSGFDFLNDLLGAQTTYETRVRDLKAIGMDSALAVQELNLKISNIAKEANLTDAQLTKLAAVFPQIGSSILGLIGGTTGTPEQALDDAKDAVEKAKDALRQSFDKEIDTLQQAKDAHEDYIKSIQKFLDDLKLDDNLSPLDPAQRFQEAQKQYVDTAQKALTGDDDAISKLQDVSQQYLEEAKAYYGTSEGYFSIFNDVQSTLEDVLDSAKDQASDLDKQLAALQAQQDAQLGTTDAVLSVKDAIDQLAAATAAQAAAQSAYDAAQQAAFDQMMQLLQQTGQSYDPFITSLYHDVLGRAPDAEGAAYYTNMLNSGMSEDDIRAKFIANAQPELERGYATPAYASGGFHSGGLRLVGERGPELEATGASRIWNASDTARMLSSAMQVPSFAAGNDNSAASMLKELQALRQEVASLREERKQGDNVVAAGAQATVGAVQQTNQSVKSQTDALRRKQYERRYGR
jgi:hypothetical protein